MRSVRMGVCIRTFVPENVAQLVRSLHDAARQIYIAATFHIQIRRPDNVGFELCKDNNK